MVGTRRRRRNFGPPLFLARVVARGAADVFHQPLVDERVVDQRLVDQRLVDQRLVDQLLVDHLLVAGLLEPAARRRRTKTASELVLTPVLFLLARRSFNDPSVSEKQFCTVEPT